MYGSTGRIVIARTIFRRPFFFVGSSERSLVHSTGTQEIFMFDLTGQTAIVTGSATGIGEAIARQLSAAGARVAIADIDSAAATATAAAIGGAFPITLDITNPDLVSKAVAEVLETTGSIQIVVNN